MATSQPPRHEEAKQARSYVSFITDEKDLEKKKTCLELLKQSSDYFHNIIAKKRRIVFA